MYLILSDCSRRLFGVVGSRVPDYRGRFLRGLQSGHSVGETVANTLKSHNHTQPTHRTASQSSSSARLWAVQRAVSPSLNCTQTTTIYLDIAAVYSDFHPDRLREELLKDGEVFLTHGIPLIFQQIRLSWWYHLIRIPVYTCFEALPAKRMDCFRCHTTLTLMICSDVLKV